MGRLRANPGRSTTDTQYLKLVHLLLLLMELIFTEALLCARHSSSGLLSHFICEETKAQGGGMLKGPFVPIYVKPEPIRSFKNFCFLLQRSHYLDSFEGLIWLSPHQELGSLSLPLVLGFRAHWGVLLVI